MGLINWNIAGHPTNWIKIGLMALFFCLGAELLAKSTKAQQAVVPPNIMP